ncbi:prolyl oligopeptidase family serine peptidase [Flavobacterium qiangtangense]|uniref:Prolyl oligopeptidase family serine peptidase n=1 Tax=Flavobacterium qiangtangense TaxID=1442595 RepID=A0ABW1PJF2_9FLAO
MKKQGKTNCRKAVLWLMMAIATLAQAQTKKILSVDDFDKWHTMQPTGIATRGNWVAYRLEYEYSTDTLFVKSTENEIKYCFPRARQGRFVDEKTFACILPDKSLSITSLQEGRSKQVPSVSDFQPINEGSLLFVEQEIGNIKTIAVLKKNGVNVWSDDRITDYALSENADFLAYCKEVDGRYEVFYTALGQDMTVGKPIAVGENAFDAFSISPEGNSVAFASIKQDSAAFRIPEKIFYYDAILKKGLSISNESVAEMTDGMELAPVFGKDLRIAADGKRVFVSLRHKNKKVFRGQSGVQIWNSFDSESFPRTKMKLDEGEFLFSVWMPAKREIKVISDKNTEVVILTGSENYALTYDYFENNPTMEHEPNRNIYIVDIESGQRKLILKDFTGSEQGLEISPAGKYIAYFLEGNWWQYEIRSGRHICISKDSQANFKRKDYDSTGWHPPAGPTFWAPGDKSMLYYDQNDIWKYIPATAKKKRLTKGRESGMEYRFYKVDNETEFHFQKAAVVAIENPVILYGRAIDNTKTGFFEMRDQKIDTLILSNKKNTRLAFSKDRKYFRFVEEDYENAPRLIVRDVKHRQDNTVMTSNQQQNNYKWGKAERLQYHDAEGKQMQGIVYYPNDYDQYKKYPMIVYVYEKQSHRLMDYINPSLYSPIGFNPSLMTASGYFVLCPDIHYKKGKAGVSAVDCVTAAVEKAITIASINTEKIGLMGASFGGFETNFIITKTTIFSAAVAGSGMSDFISGYFSVNGNDMLFDSWRYTTDQPRMGVSPYENWDSYMQNSPLRFATNIQTPLLMWVGENDGQVNPSQSLELFVALRNLKKQCTLVVYEKELHAMSEKHNQKDLTQKTMEWFNHFLKGEEKPKWGEPIKF